MKLSQTEINVILESLNLHYLDICRVLEKSDNLGDIEKKNDPEKKKDKIVVGEIPVMA